MFLKNLNYRKFKQYSILLLILSIVYSSGDKTEYINQNWPVNKNKQKIINLSNTNKLDCPNGIGLPGWELCGKCDNGICLTGKYDQDGNCAAGDEYGAYK